MPWNLILQLGISGLVVGVGYKLAMALIVRWSEGDKARTVAIGDGFRAIVEGHQAVIRTMNEHQLAEMNIFREHAVSIGRIEAKVDNVFDLTPVRGMLEARAEREEADTPVEKPVKRAATPAHGNPSLPYGLKNRPKTNGGG